MKTQAKLEVDEITLEHLSQREIEVFRMIGQGVSTKEIAARLGRGVKTIETYRYRIKEKLQIKTAPELIVWASRWVQWNHPPNTPHAPPPKTPQQMAKIGATIPAEMKARLITLATIHNRSLSWVCERAFNLLLRTENRALGDPFDL